MDSRNFTAGGSGDSGMTPLINTQAAPSFDDQFGSYDIDQLANYSAASSSSNYVQNPVSTVSEMQQILSAAASEGRPSIFEEDNDEMEEMTFEQKESSEEEKLEPMKEMLYKLAAMQPVEIDPATIQKPKRRNVRISHDPQSVAARHRRERISERMRILQRLVPGATKMDTATMLDEAIRYVKFLKKTVHDLQNYSADHASGTTRTTDDQLQPALPLNNIGSRVQINNTTSTTMDWPPPPPDVGPTQGGGGPSTTTRAAQPAASTGSSTTVLCNSSSMDHHQ